MKNQYKGGDCLIKGARTVYRFDGGLARKKGVDTPMHIVIRGS